MVFKRVFEQVFFCQKSGGSDILILKNPSGDVAHHSNFEIQRN
jgi:hypothetical protein